MNQNLYVTGIGTRCMCCGAKPFRCKVRSQRRFMWLMTGAGLVIVTFIFAYFILPQIIIAVRS